MRHDKEECSHDDCAHYIDLEKEPLSCEKTFCHMPQSFKEKCTPWAEVSGALVFFYIRFLIRASNILRLQDRLCLG